MKKIFTIGITLSLIFSLNLKSLATIHIINVSSFQFSPNATSAVTGDTIRWIWVNGSHTTTCDGSQFTSLPAGAASWNHNINSNSVSFDYVPTVAGAYAYKCIPHAGGGMVGAITVSLNTNLFTQTPPANHLDVLSSEFSAQAEVKFYVPSDGKVSVNVYDLTGRKVQTIVDQVISKGEHSYTWDTNVVPQGTYLCRLDSKDFVLTRKFIVRR